MKKLFITRVIGVALMLAIVITVFTGIGVIQHTHAASNGQEIQLDCWLPMSFVSIDGPNQNNVVTYWQDNQINFWNTSNHVFANNMWWKGNITINWFTPATWDSPHQHTYSIPQNWGGGNVYHINCQW